LSGFSASSMFPLRSFPPPVFSAIVLRRQGNCRQGRIYMTQNSDSIMKLKVDNNYHCCPV
jgi:hypothetical protein